VSVIGPSIPGESDGEPSGRETTSVAMSAPSPMDASADTHAGLPAVTMHTSFMPQMGLHADTQVPDLHTKLARHAGEHTDESELLQPSVDATSKSKKDPESARRFMPAWYAMPGAMRSGVV
jgi:hypothetical protein